MSWDVNQFLRDLSDFNTILTQKEVPIDTQSLYSLEGESQGFLDIDFNIKDIEFRLNESISGTVPHNVSAYKITVDLDFFLDPYKNKTIDDPFKNIDGYSFQLLIKGIVKQEGGQEKEFSNCWHLDRHITGGGQTKVTHPFYHFQNGGNNLEVVDTGQVLLTGAPRLPHPPLDIFLAIHFVISNFYNRNSHPFVDELFRDDDYNLIIERAQERMWKPYYEAYRTNGHSDYSIINITPLYTIH